MTSVNDGSKTVSYSYDLLGQLIRANDPYDTTAGSAGTTWVYSYDLGGNMTSRKAYAYTTGTVGTAVQTISYTYGDANWKDKLTAYNGAAISYDAIGNPTSDGTWTYTWAKGRQLQSMSKSGTSVSYTYNEDGLRVQKNVSGTVTSYILHGKNVVQLTQGSNNLHFFYGADGSPAMVVYNGASYGYVKNLQGDIVSIVNSSGAEVVHYSYDAWGKLLGKTGTLATSLGTLNPFRYRGYVYDEETGLYYLRSRYYNPAWNRFVNGDVGIKITRALMRTNIFIYCSNSIPAKADADGTDAYWLTDSGNVGGLGHTSLLLEDDDGTWYYFYWGPEKVGIPVWTQASVIVQDVPISLDGNGMLDLNALNSTLNQGKAPIYKRQYDCATLFKGDYSRSVKKAQQLRFTYEESVFRGVAAYNVMFTNCMQASANVMQASNPFNETPLMWLLFAAASIDVVPRYVGWAMEMTGLPTVKVPKTENGLIY